MRHFRRPRGRRPDEEPEREEPGAPEEPERAEDTAENLTAEPEPEGEPPGEPSGGHSAEGEPQRPNTRRTTRRAANNPANIPGGSDASGQPTTGQRGERTSRSGPTRDGQPGAQRTTRQTSPAAQTRADSPRPDSAASGRAAAAQHATDNPARSEQPGKHFRRAKGERPARGAQHEQASARPSEEAPRGASVQDAWRALKQRKLAELGGRKWEGKSKREKEAEATKRAHKELNRRLGRDVDLKTVQRWRRKGTTTKSGDDQKLSKWTVIDEHGGVKKTAETHGVTTHAVTAWRDHEERTAAPWRAAPQDEHAPEWTEGVTVRVTVHLMWDDTSGPFTRSTEKTLTAAEANTIGLPIDGDTRPNDPDVADAIERFLELKYFEATTATIQSIESLEYL